MRIAIPHDNGNVFQHFGHTEEFKIYTVEDGAVVSSEILSAAGSGHEALAGVLRDNSIDALVCGGIGGGAMSALEEAGIEVCAGAEGVADEIVEAYLRGELVDSGVNCDHHDHHDEADECSCGGCSDDDECGCGCGDDEDCGCAGGCGGCSGCAPEPIMEGKNVGKTCRTHYRGTLNDGTQFDSSYDRGEPLEFICGVGMMIRGFDEAVKDMEVGDKVNVHIMPEDAYGEVDPDAIFSMELELMPQARELSVNDHVYLQDMYGRPFPAKVVEKDDEKITFDANHEMAGKELNFEIELVDVLDA